MPLDQGQYIEAGPRQASKARTQGRPLWRQEDRVPLKAGGHKSKVSLTRVRELLLGQLCC
jgi:hypothetical protein